MRNRLANRAEGQRKGKSRIPYKYYLTKEQIIHRRELDNKILEHEVSKGDVESYGIGDDIIGHMTGVLL